MEIYGPFRIFVDYGKPDEISEAVRLGRFENEVFRVDQSMIPLVGRGLAWHTVSECCFNLPKTTWNVIDYFQNPDCPLKLADPLTALLYAAQLSERQRKRPLAVIFEVGDRSFVLVLRTLYQGERKAGIRGLYVSKAEPESLFYKDVAFLCVPKQLGLMARLFAKFCVFFNRPLRWWLG